jgi:hypothetical protein
MKCEICNKNIATTFLNKIQGTNIKDEKGKQHAICFECQSNNKDKHKSELLKQIK